MECPNNELPIDVLRKVFRYDPATGVIERFFRNVWRICSYKDISGYIRVELTYNSKLYQIKGHRLGWALYYGKFPEDQLDHINRNKIDNRICNLRVADYFIQNNNRTFTNKQDKFIENKIKIFEMLLNGVEPKTIKDLSKYFPFSFKGI